MLSKERAAKLLEEELQFRDYALQLMLDYPFLEATFLEVYRQLVIEITSPGRELACAGPTAVYVSPVRNRVDPFLQEGQFARGIVVGNQLRVFRRGFETYVSCGDRKRTGVFRVYTHYHLVPKSVCASELTDLQLFGCEIATKLGEISGEHGFMPGTQPWDF